MHNGTSIASDFINMVPVFLVGAALGAAWWCACRRIRVGAAGDLLFFRSTMSLAAAIAFLLMAYLGGITPATPAARALINEVRAGVLAESPAVSSVLKIIDSGLYVSQSDLYLLMHAVSVSGRYTSKR